MTDRQVDINKSAATYDEEQARVTVEYDQTASILVSSEERWFYYKVIFVYEFISFSLVAWGIESATVKFHLNF
jgi:hypothetical protein